ncbi:MAG: ribosome recycling factor [Bacteroidales bacterium]
MNPQCIIILDQTRKEMQAATTHLEHELTKIRTGKASPQMLDGVKVDYYGTMTPIEQIANVHTPDARQIIVQPWDKNMLNPIDKAIQTANLGFNPQNNGEVLRINVPTLTEDRRKDLVKKARAEAENSKVVIRNFRRTANDNAKKLEKMNVPEDEIKGMEKEIQNITDGFISQVDKILEAKEKDIMTV